MNGVMAFGSQPLRQLRRQGHIDQDDTSDITAVRSRLAARGKNEFL